MTTHCLAVTGGKSGKLSQASWLLVRTIIKSYLFTYLVDQFGFISGFLNNISVNWIACVVFGLTVHKITIHVVTLLYVHITFQFLGDSVTQEDEEERR